MRRRILGYAAFATAASAGAVLGWAGERRALRGRLPEHDPAWAELREPIRGRDLEIESFDGTRLRADVLGPDTRDGQPVPTVLLAHGYTLSRHGWQYQRRDLADRYRVVSWDQRGHGESEEAASGDYSIEAFGRDLAAVLDACAPRDERVVVVGHSMGGMAVLSYAAQFPEEVGQRLRGAVLIGTAGSAVLLSTMLSTGSAVLGGVEHRVAEGIWRALGKRARIADRVAGSATDLSSLLVRAIALSPGASPAHVALIEDLILAGSTSVKAAIGPVFSSLDLLDAAKMLAVPTLVVVGERDRLTPPHQSHKLIDRLPDARLVELPGVGHHPMLEAHDETTALLRAFVDGLT